jgi:hypothetical protein
MPIRLAWLPGCLLISSMICASAQVKQHSIKLQDLPDVAELCRLEDSGEVHKVAADSKQARLTALPPDAMQHDPRLKGVCDFDGDGTDEVFISWLDLEIPRVDPTDKREVIVIFGDPTTISMVRIYRVKSATAAEFVSELRIEGRHLDMRFAKASSLRDTNRVFLSVMGGAKWSVFYALSFDGKSTFLITEYTGNSSRVPGGALWGELDDHNGDEVREWVMWSLEAVDHKCPHGLYIPSFGPEIYRPSSSAVKRIWPPEDWAIADETAPVAITPSSSDFSRRSINALGSSEGSMIVGYELMRRSKWICLAQHCLFSHLPAVLIVERMSFRIWPALRARIRPRRSQRPQRI